MNRAVVIIMTLALLLFAPPALHDLQTGRLAFAQTPSLSVTPTQSEKYKQMDILMGEHSVLLANLLTSRYSRQPNVQAGREALNANTRELAAFIREFYGNTAGDQFTAVWNRHIDSFVRYTDAVRSNDEERQTQALRELQSFTEDVARLLSRRNEDMFAIAQNYFSQHVLDQKSLIDAFDERDYERMYREMHDSYRHATSMTRQLQ